MSDMELMCRFFMYWLLLFLTHNMAISLFRAIGALSRNIVVANALGSMALFMLLLLGGFLLSVGERSMYACFVAPF